MTAILIGIRYFFKNEEEAEEILKSKSLLVEGFIALEKTKNVFDIMCQLEKKMGFWEISSAYTYKPKYAKNIKWLMD